MGATGRRASRAQAPLSVAARVPWAVRSVPGNQRGGVMKYALLNPPWSFEGSIYFGCREPHLPLEYGYAKSLLERQGHQVLLIDGHLNRLSNRDIAERVAAFRPDFTVVTTAPSYL